MLGDLVTPGSRNGEEETVFITSNVPDATATVNEKTNTNVSTSRVSARSAEREFAQRAMTTQMRKDLPEPLRDDWVGSLRLFAMMVS
jgi:hypothetical protein